MSLEPVEVEFVGVTDAGLVRDSNEDWFAAGDLDGGELGEGGQLQRTAGPRGPLFVVCDGMGGVAGGEVASRLAVDTVWQEMRASRATEKREVFARHLRRAIRAAHQAVVDEAAARPELRGMGTTVSAAGVAGTALLIAQVGDSRAYIERAGSLTQVTRDQSVVSALVHAGRLSELEARLSEKRSLILQALGTGDDVDVAISLVELRRGDRLLMCSDGLHGPVNDDALRHALDEHGELDRAVRALVELSHQAGAPDNITAILARFTGERLAPPADSDDRPSFAELDHNEEGAEALTSTSAVGRRLAARAGLRPETAPPPIPATGQHRAMRTVPLDPAHAALARGSRPGLLAWIAAAAVAVAILVFLFRDLLF
jgi:serine/threonine protein phosphatase PrpC